MDITATSLISKRIEGLNKIKNSHIKTELSHIQNKIKMANTVGFDECIYEVQPNTFIQQKEVYQALHKELKSRGFKVVGKKSSSGGILLYIFWKK